MGEAQLLEMRYSCGGPVGCSEEEAGMAAYYVRRLVLSAAGVVSGVKPASLFNFMPQSCMHCRDTGCEVCRSARETIAVGARALACFGVTLVVLDRRGGRTVLFAYREVCLARILARPECSSFLEDLGYDVSGAGSVVRELRRRMAAYYGSPDRSAPYPHEVGLLLGYPLTDVQGFMAGASSTCRGGWKAYGDQETAEAMFAHVKRCEERCWERFKEGESLRELLSLPVTQLTLGLA